MEKFKNFLEKQTNPYDDRDLIKTARNFFDLYVDDIKGLNKQLDTYKDSETLRKIASGARGMVWKKSWITDKRMPKFSQQLEILATGKMEILKKKEMDAALEKTKKSVTPADWKNFEGMLKTHDWHYLKSDDHRDYTQGKMERDNIDRLYQKLSLVDKQKAKNLIKKYKK